MDRKVNENQQQIAENKKHHEDLNKQFANLEASQLVYEDYTSLALEKAIRIAKGSQSTDL